MAAGEDRVLYEGFSARSGIRIYVTTRWCVVNDSEYPVAELYDLGISRGHRDPLHLRGLAGFGLVLGVLAAIVLAIRSGWTGDVWRAAGVAVAGTAAVTFLPAVLITLFRRPYEIWGGYRGNQVRLFSTFNKEQFGQVSRALIRAQEANAG